MYLCCAGYHPRYILQNSLTFALSFRCLMSFRGDFQGLKGKFGEIPTLSPQL